MRLLEILKLLILSPDHKNQHSDLKKKKRLMYS